MTLARRARRDTVGARRHRREGRPPGGRPCTGPGEEARHHRPLQATKDQAAHRVQVSADGAGPSRRQGGPGVRVIADNGYAAPGSRSRNDDGLRPDTGKRRRLSAIRRPLTPPLAGRGPPAQLLRAHHGLGPNPARRPRPGLLPAQTRSRQRAQAMRCLKRRLSDVVYRRLCRAGATQHATSPGGHSGQLHSPARPAQPLPPALRTSHLPDPPARTLQPLTKIHLTREKPVTRAIESLNYTL